MDKLIKALESESSAASSRLRSPPTPDHMLTMDQLGEAWNKAIDILTERGDTPEALGGAEFQQVRDELVVELLGCTPDAKRGRTNDRIHNDPLDAGVNPIFDGWEPAMVELSFLHEEDRRTITMLLARVYEQGRRNGIALQAMHEVEPHYTTSYDSSVCAYIADDGTELWQMFRIPAHEVLMRDFPELKALGLFPDYYYY